MFHTLIARIGMTIVTCTCLVLVSYSVAQTNQREGKTGVAAISDGQHAGTEHASDQIRYYMLKVDDKANSVTGASGKIEWVRMAAPSQPSAPTVRALVGNEAEVTVNCRTTPTNSSGRKTCNDEEVHNLPDGYVFVENDARTEWHSDIGSSNTVDIIWENRVEVIPGTGITQARTMRVRGHARSGHGYGERGHTHATVRCKFVRYVQ